MKDSPDGSPVENIIELAHEIADVCPCLYRHGIRDAVRAGEIRSGDPAVRSWPLSSMRRAAALRQRHSGTR
jgi:hypothetical protein